MSLDFSVISQTQQQFGDQNINVGTFAGNTKDFNFSCEGVNSTEHALLMFQSRWVGSNQSIKINGSTIFGGIPGSNTIDGVAGRFTFGFADVPAHEHVVNGHSNNWTGNTMIVGTNILQETGNVLTVRATEVFIIDNVIILFKTKIRKPDLNTGINGVADEAKN